MPMGQYKRTKEQYLKICSPERNKKISEKLKKIYKEGKKVCWTKGKKLSEQHKNKIKISSLKGENNHSWKGNNAGYVSLHDWIKKYFGKANKCDNRNNKILSFECSKKSNNFQWALKKGNKYSRKIEDYFQLCVSCHSKYDRKREIKICPIKNCGKKIRRFGYCEKHGIRFKKFGNPFAVKYYKNPIKFKKD